MSIFSAFSDSLDPTKNKVGRTSVGRLTVSTRKTFDLGYETAIVDANGSYPVERYEGLEQATDGHARWVVLAESLTEITQLGHPILGIKPKAIILTPAI